MMSFVTAVAGGIHRFHTDDVVEQRKLWQDFRQRFAKTYPTSEEEETRFRIFVNNLKRIDERNDMETGTATFGITKFTDLTREEFESTFLMPPLSDDKIPTSNVVTHVPAYNGTSSLVDWTGIYTTPVRDQGYCGSCWAFSATEQIESDAMRQHGVSYVLSVEQLVDCTPLCGCLGGETETAYDYVRVEGGLETEEKYPYTAYFGRAGDCAASKRKEVVGVRSYTTIYGEDNMAAYVKSTGPLSVCLSATGWEYYTGGIMETCPKYVNHCVQAVGVDDSRGGYWKVRNSYGENWGEDGYIRLAYGQNTCFITRDPTYVDTFVVV